MYKKLIIVFSVTLMLSTILNAVDKLPRKFKSSLLSGQLSNRYYGSGFSFMKFNGHSFGTIACTYLVLKNKADKKIYCREKHLCNATDISISEDGKKISFKTLRPVSDKNGKVYADIAREWQLEGNTITVKAKLIAKEDIKLAGCWLLRDIFSIRSTTVKGATLECLGIGRDPQSTSAMIPREYSKDKWNVRGTFSQIKLITEDTELIATAVNDSGMSIVYSGGNSFGIYFKPIIKYHDVDYKTGDEIDWAYTIKYTNIK